VDQPVTERRVDARFPPPSVASTRATLRPGCIVFVVDLSAGGALVQAFRPLRPGARVHLQLVADARTVAMTAQVLRCAVWSLDPIDGVIYRGALQFEDRCEWPWDAGARQGNVLCRPSPPVEGETSTDPPFEMRR
jgi:hypothetical protein